MRRVLFFDRAHRTWVIVTRRSLPVLLLVNMSWNAYRRAVARREFNVLLALLATEKCVTTPAIFIARHLGIVVMSLGLFCVIMNTTVIYRDAIPIVAAPGSTLFYFYKFLTATISFHILHNYVASCCLSLRLGSCPTPSEETGDSVATGGQVAVEDNSYSDSEDSHEEAVYVEGTNGTATRPLPTSLIREGESIRVRKPSPAEETESSMPRAIPQCSVTSRRWRLWHRLWLFIRRPRWASSTTVALVKEFAERGEQYSPWERRTRELDRPRRYCKRCHRLKAPREHHCSLCDACVPKMDHHCPFINNCVDAENQRFFVLFLGWLALATPLSTLCVGYPWLNETMYQHNAQRLEVKARTSPLAAQRLAELSPPYGPRGVYLTTTYVTMCCLLDALMALFFIPFFFHHLRILVSNTTPIEDLVLAERLAVFTRTGFAYRSPYDLGWWRNLVEVVRTPGDPVVRQLLEPLYHVNEKTGSAYVVVPPAPRTWCEQIQSTTRMVFALLWLSLPTFRPSTADGLHYTTYFAEVRDANGKLLGTDNLVI